MKNARLLAGACALLLPAMAAMGAVSVNLGKMTASGRVNQIDVLPGASVPVLVYLTSADATALGAGQLKLKVSATLPTDPVNYFTLTAVAFISPWSNSVSDKIVPTMPSTLNAANNHTSGDIGTMINSIPASANGDFATLTVTVSASALPGAYSLTGVRSSFGDPSFDNDILGVTGAALTVNVLCNVGACLDAPTVSSWKSVKTHAGVGEKAMAITTNKVEPRKGILRIRATFSHAMQVPADVDSYLTLQDSANAPVTHGTPVMTPTTLEVTVTEAVANQKQLKLSLNNGSNKLKRADGAKVALADTSITVRCLIGDVTGDVGSGNGVVNTTDMAMVRDKMGQPVDGSNCTYDVNLSGGITISDMAVVKLNLGNTAQ